MAIRVAEGVENTNYIHVYIRAYIGQTFEDPIKVAWERSILGGDMIDRCACEPQDWVS